MAGRPRATELSEKHWKALKLFEDGKSQKEVAAAIKVSLDYLQDLCYGDVKKTSSVAVLFKKEYQKISDKRDERLKSLVKENQEIVQSLINDVIKDFKSRPSTQKLTDEEKKLLNMYNNSLNNSTPAVSIGSLSYSYTQGLTPEDLVHEFVRLKSLTETSFNRRRIQDLGEAGPGEVSPVDEPGG